MNWKQIGRFLRTLFLLRVAMITLVLIAALGPVSLFLADSLLGNLFDLRFVRLDAPGPTVQGAQTSWYLFIVSFTAFLAALAAVTVINLVIHYGRDRFDDPALDLDQKRPLLTFFSGIACALSLVVSAAWHSRGSSMPGSEIPSVILWGMPLLGLICAMGLVLIAKVVQLVFTNPKTTHHPPPYLIFPVYLIPAVERVADKLYCWTWSPLSSGKRMVNRISQWPLEILRCAGQGYLIDCEAPVGSLALRSGHVFALALSVLAFLFYFGIGYAKGKISDKPANVPALAYLLLFLIVACWVLGALAFFLDRYRVPLLSSIAILSLATTFAPQSDHVYRVEHTGTPSRPTPSEVIAKRSAGGKNRITLVATAGGGIQAAAWTARVLQGLGEKCKEPPSACDFRGSVALVSGVSGGSLGAIAYARSFTDLPDGKVAPVNVLANAEQPALDEVAWAWTNPDVARALLPWFRTQYVDRGWALEEKWSAVHKLYKPGEPGSLRRLRRYFGWVPHGKDTFLGDWVRLAKEGTMPALLLNATLVEKGQPLVFSSTEFLDANDTRGLKDFHSMYPGFDIRVNTAARLSASFPYVAPAARSNAKTVTVGDDHVVDGGYYDNFGITSLLAWLQNAIESRKSRDQVMKGESASKSDDDEKPLDILILQIRPFSDSGATPGRKAGWGYQLDAPVDTLLDVRDTSQAARDRTELALFAKAYIGSVNIRRADFVFPNFGTTDSVCNDTPLSWKLSYEQTKCIDNGWDLFLQKNGRTVDCVVNYLKNGDPDKTCIAGSDASENGATTGAKK